MSRSTETHGGSHGAGGLAVLNLVGADVVEVSSVDDDAQITGIAAAHAIYELLCALTPDRRTS